jgi:hypothetical protein
MARNDVGAGTVILGCLGIIALFFGIIALFAWVFMLAWNAFVPAVFGGPTIDYATAFAGWVLIGLIGSAFRSVFSGGGK